MGKSAPGAADYVGAANQQAAASQANTDKQTQANRANVNSGFNNQQWTQGPDGQWTLTQGFGANQGLADRLSGAALGAAGQPIGNGDQARQQTIDSAYAEAKKRLDPQWAQAEQLHQSQLANQGVDPNSAAARANDLEFAHGRSDAYGGALANAIREGNASGHQVFADNLAAHNNPLQQLLGLAGANQGPQYNQAGKADSPDILAAQMGQDSMSLKQWQANQQALTDAIGAGGQLLGGIGKMFAF